MNTGTYKVGDKIVELGRVFRIFKIQKNRNTEGKFEKVVFFKPFFKPTHSQNFVCSIPLENIDKTAIRKPISRKEANKVLSKLKKLRKSNELPHLLVLKELLKSNNTSGVVRIIRTLSKEQKISPDNFTRSKREVFDSAMERLEQEIAISTGVTLKTARKKIETALQN